MKHWKTLEGRGRGKSGNIEVDDKWEPDILQGSKLTVASSKLLPEKPICHLFKTWMCGWKMSFPNNPNVISWKNKLILNEIIFLFIRQTHFHMVKGIISVFDYMEFRLVIDLTMGGN